MKTIKLAASCFVIGLVLTPAAGFSGDKDVDRGRSGKTGGTGEFIKDSAITSKIKAKIAADKHARTADIKVDTDKDGVVVLSGTAESQAAMHQAISISRSVDGVTKIINHIRI